MQRACSANFPLCTNCSIKLQCLVLQNQDTPVISGYLQLREYLCTALDGFVISPVLRCSIDEWVSVTLSSSSTVWDKMDHKNLITSRGPTFGLSLRTKIVRHSSEDWFLHDYYVASGVADLQSEDSKNAAYFSMYCCDTINSSKCDRSFTVMGPLTTYGVL